MSKNPVVYKAGPEYFMPYSAKNASFCRPFTGE